MIEGFSTGWLHKFLYEPSAARDQMIQWLVYQLSDIPPGGINNNPEGTYIYYMIFWCHR